MIEQMIQMVRSGQWAVFAVMFLTLFNVWLSKDSKFPFTPPSWLRPLLIIIVGQGLGVAAAFAAHVAVLPIAIHAVLSSLIAIGASHAVFSDGAPGWMQSIAGIATVIEEVEPKKESKPAGLARVGALLVVLMFLPTAHLAAQGCHASAAQLEQTAADAEHLGGCIIGTILGGQTDPGVLAQTCAGALPAVIVDVIADFEAKAHKPGDGGLQASPHLALLAEAKQKALVVAKAAK